MEEIKRKIIFTDKHEVQDHRAGTAKATIYKKGARRTMNARSAAHFVSRGTARYTDE